jgi:hypothetical protein
MANIGHLAARRVSASRREFNHRVNNREPAQGEHKPQIKSNLANTKREQHSSRRGSKSTQGTGKTKDIPASKATLIN